MAWHRKFYRCLDGYWKQRRESDKAAGDGEWVETCGPEDGGVGDPPEPER